MSYFDIFCNGIIDSLNINKQSNKVFIYILDMNKYSYKLTQLWNSLSFEEKEKAESYNSKLLTERYIISHGILRYILSYYTNHLPTNIEFIFNKYGKPYLKNSKVKFNMSHSHNLVCYIVTFDNEVGIDIELYDNNLNVNELSKLVFTPQEAILFDDLNSQEKHITFFNIWTKKEALIKAIGKGFYYPIDTIKILNIIPDSKVTLMDNNIKQEFYIHVFDRIPNYFGAIANKIKINEIVYIETYNKYGIFDNVQVVKL